MTLSLPPLRSEPQAVYAVCADMVAPIPARVGELLLWWPLHPTHGLTAHHVGTAAAPVIRRAGPDLSPERTAHLLRRLVSAGVLAVARESGDVAAWRAGRNA